MMAILTGSEPVMTTQLCEASLTTTLAHSNDAGQLPATDSEDQGVTMASAGEAGIQVHYPGRSPAPERGAAAPVEGKAAGGDQVSSGGGGPGRPLGKCRVYLRQENAA